MLEKEKMFGGSFDRGFGENKKENQGFDEGFASKIIQFKVLTSVLMKNAKKVKVLTGT